MELLAQTRVGRNINRPFLSDDQLESALERPVVKRLCRLARLRNTHPAFDGEFSLALPSNDVIELMWLNGEHQANASIAVGRREFSLTLSGSPSPITGWDDLPGSQ
jgi:sucrose phosphorylase